VAPLKTWRETIFEIEAEVLEHQHLDGRQHILRLAAPAVTEHAQPGSFVHLRCDPAIPLRRPMSIMRRAVAAGWIDVLYKAHGAGTEALTRRKSGDTLAVLGPIGKPFKLDGYRRRPLLIGGGVGIPPMIFLAEHLKSRRELQPLVLMGSEVPFPFKARPSQFLIDGLPAAAIAAMALLEDWGLPSRLASGQDFAGCYRGLVTDLARAWLEALGTDVHDDVEVFACGPTPMLRAVQQLAFDFGLPGELSLEEYMACAVGGCAGCAAAVRVDGKMAMRRVCVDGPVFDADTVVFER
jgi:dihydroorotate dehydrogenase electron transfer subunit